jgi:hypothetical protein
MLKFLMQRFLGDSLRNAILRGIKKSVVEKLKMNEPTDQEQICFNIMEQIAIDSGKGLEAGKQLVGDLNKVQKKRTTRFKPSS